MNGITGGSGYVDMNYCYKEDFPEVIKNAELNGFTKPEKVAESVQESKEQIAKKVKATIEIDDHIYSGLLEEMT